MSSEELLIEEKSVKIVTGMLAGMLLAAFGNGHIFDF